MDNTNNPLDPPAAPGQTPEPTSVMPTTPAAPAAGGTGPPVGGPPPLADPEPEGTRNTAAIAAGALVGLLLLIGAVILFTRGDDDSLQSVDSAPIVTEETTTTIVEETTTIVEETTTLPETTTTVPETTTTMPETTTTVAPTTLPATTIAPTTIPVVTVPPEPEATMWDLIVNSPDLSEFKAAVEAAGLVDLLDGPDALTIFAPSNQAFADFRAGVGNEAALADLEALIRHHLVAGALTSEQVLSVESLDSLAGNAIAVDAAAKTVDGGSFLVLDVEQSNSVLHVVDLVLLPAA